MNMKMINPELYTRTLGEQVDRYYQRKDDASDVAAELDTRQTAAEGDIADLQAALDEIKAQLTTAEGKISDLVIHRTLSGDGVTITDSAGANPAEEIIVDILPIQDFHGYASPWDEGDSANLIPLVLADLKAANTAGTWSGNTYTLDGMTFTVLTDTDSNITGIHSYGLASADVNFNLTVPSNPVPLPNLDKHFYFDDSCIVYNDDFIASGSKFLTIQLYNETEEETETYRTDNAQGITKFPRGEAVLFSACLSFSAGKSVNVVTTPMLRHQSQKGTFVPYTNHCSMTGQTCCTVNVNGTPIAVSWATKAGTIHGGRLNLTTGLLTVYEYYDHYEYDVLAGRWISSHDKYGQASPTYGAQVVDFGGVAATYELEPVAISLVAGHNEISADCGAVTVKYAANPTECIKSLRDWLDRLTNVDEEEHNPFDFLPATWPIITTQPADTTVADVGDTATVTVNATGTDLHYRWGIQKADGTCEYCGTDSPTFSIIMTTEWQESEVHCAIIQGNAQIQTRSAKLIVESLIENQGEETP